MKLFLHQTQNTIGDFQARLSYIKEIINSSAKANTLEIHVFPELYLTGYPLQDLCLQKIFYEQYLNLVEEINSLLIKLPKNPHLQFLMGGLKYELSEFDYPSVIENSVIQGAPGKPLEHIYSKRLLPNYDIFDEKKYFSPGKSPGVIQIQEFNIGILICEDMWPSASHKSDPTELLHKHIIENNQSLDLIINLSASPFSLCKNELRVERAKNISESFNCPFAYVNQCSGEDEILFDGGSFVVHENEISQCKFFHKDTLELNIQKKTSIKIGDYKIQKTHAWESLFRPLIDFSSSLPRIPELNKNRLDNLLEALKFGLQEYASKCGFKNFLVALSGGIDSALVLAIAKLSLKPGQSIKAVYLPSRYSSDLSLECVQEQCKTLEIELLEMSIEPMLAAAIEESKRTLGQSFQGLALENIQSRIRGSLIYSISNQTGAMVINTSNKSELSVGYSTQYGDSVGAISLLGDLYKTEIFQLSQYLHDFHEKAVPQKVISRPPSAELREDQRDQDSLPPYERMDAILELILSYQKTLENIQDFGFESAEIKKIFDLYRLSEYKRAQFCPIVKLKPKSFGFGYRVPISKTYKNLLGDKYE